MKNKVAKKAVKSNRKKEQQFAWGRNLTIDFSLHGMERSIFRLGVSPNDVIQDIRHNYDNAYRQKDHKQDKFLVIGKHGKYIVSIKGVVITVLSHDMTPVDKFNEKPCKGKYLQTYEEKVPVFKRSKIL